LRSFQGFSHLLTVSEVPYCLKSVYLIFNDLVQNMFSNQNKCSLICWYTKTL